jgi:hypothetical protein
VYSTLFSLSLFGKSAGFSVWRVLAKLSANPRNYSYASRGTHLKNENRKNDTIITEWIPPFAEKKD